MLLLISPKATPCHIETGLQKINMGLKYFVYIKNKLKKKVFLR